MFDLTATGVCRLARRRWSCLAMRSHRPDLLPAEGRSTDVEPTGTIPTPGNEPCVRKTLGSLVLVLLTSLGHFASVQPAEAQSCIVTTPIGTGNEEALGTAIQSDGKIVVVGFTDVGAGNLDFAVVRYDSSFGLDTSFDVDGKVTTPIGAANETAVAVALQPDGKIVVVGFSDVGAGNNDFAVVRYNANGSLDFSFDVDGKVTTGIGADDQARSVAIQPDGKIVVAGWSFFGGRNQFAAARYNANGSLDATFDTDGIVTTALGATNDKGFSVALQPDGKILVAGETEQGAGNFDYGVVRYNPNGILDATFDLDGRVTTFIGSGDFGRTVSLQSDLKIVVTGTTTIAGSLDFGAVRYNPNGSLDISFDVDGKVSTPVGSLNEFQFAAALQLDGKIVTVGHSDVGAANFDVAAVRYSSNGSLDTSFSGDGKVTTPIGTLDDRGHALALQPDGKIVVAGSSHNGSNFDFSVVRYHPDGSVDTTCGTCASAGTWWNYTWGRRRKLSFDNSGQAQNLSGFPVLVKLDSTRIDYSRTQNAGQDIRFVDADDQTLLDHEIELWNEAGTSYVWVRVPQIDASSGADSIYMYYDNVTALDAQDAAGVWSGGGYQGVWHLKEDPAGAPPQMKDSTANLNHGTAEFSPVQTPGQIDGSLSFDGTNERDVNIPNTASLSLPTELTVSGWARLALPIDGQARLIVAKWKLAGGFSFWLGKLDATQMAFGLDGGGASTAFAPIGFVNDLAWHHVVGVAEAGGTMRIYVDGVQRGTSAFTPPIQTGTSEVRIGRSPDVLLQDWNGGIDEVRVENVARPADWIRAEYLATTDRFIAYGAETGACFLRSIGTAPNRSSPGDGTVTATDGSIVVTGSGTLWNTWNRGRGDVITIDGTNYVVLGVDSGTQLRLTSPFAGTSGSGKSYTMVRQFTTLPDWEDCVDGPPGVACPFFPVTSASLVTDRRSEVGIAYKDSVFVDTILPLEDVLVIDGSTTGPFHTITLTADPGNRHNGIPGSGVVIDMGGIATDFNGILISDNFVTLEWMEVRNGAGLADGIQAAAVNGSNRRVVRNCIVHDAGSRGIQVRTNAVDSYELDVYNNFVYRVSRGIFVEDPVVATSTIRILNNTVFSCTSGTTPGIGAVAPVSGTPVTVSNNISHSNTSGSFGVLGLNPASRNNLASDLTGTTHSPAGGGLNSVPLTGAGGVNFIDTTVGSENLHLRTTAPLSAAQDAGVDLSSLFRRDIDGVTRLSPWEIGADDVSQLTAVTLMSFEASGVDGAVELAWRTGSELDNLGFHLYRSLSEAGPWTRLTPSLVPGLGSSAVGQAYSFRDAGLVNGTRYYYRLEDVDAASKATSHGPVFAVPTAAAGGAPNGGAVSGATSGKKKGASAPSCPDWVVAAYGSMAGSASGASLSCTRHGDPEAVSLGVVSRDARSATLELRTGGFYALREPAGGVRVFVPGFDFREGPQAASLPFRRALVDAVVGRRVQLGGVRVMDQVGFAGLVPAALGKAEMQVSRDGTVRAGRRAVRALTLERVSSELALLLPSVFQGETKSAVVEISPLRFDARRQQLLLAKRVRVRLLFTGRETGESGRGSLGRREKPREPVTGELLARLYTTSRGLHAVSFEQLFPERRRGFAASQLRLERQGQAQGFHLEPASDSFGPGSGLYFHADATAGSADFSSATAWELVRSREGVSMPLVSAAPSGEAVTSASTGQVSFEVNRFYQPGLLDAPDLWLWEGLGSGATRAKSFSLTGVDTASSRTGELDIVVQGASESGRPVDHHLGVSLNGALVGEAQFAGKRPYRMRLGVPVSLLREGTNELSLTNVADTGVSSYVFLDRFAVGYPQTSSLAGGAFEGTWSEAGSVDVTGVVGAVAVLDVTAAGAADASGGAWWLSGYQATGGRLRFRAEAGRRYLAVSEAALLTPRVAAPAQSSLRSSDNQADYILIAPRAFLVSAEPLLERRRDQGLQARGVAFEEIADEFGHGQPSAEAIKGFLAFAFHSWTRPSPRYVLLVGDSTYDPRNFTSTAQPSPLPALWAKTSYLWTVSDPQLAAVNGDDALPDMAIGRLPAATVEEAQTLVGKLLAWEDSGQGLSGQAVLVADNPDLAGDFDADIDDIARSFFQGRGVSLLKLSQLGAQMRPAIREAMSSGLSFLSYVGHGGAAVWASENVWNSWDAPSLQAQSQQPLLLTLNCLNGYFVAPAFNSLPESLLKAEGRGAIAAFSPSGLSLDGPAHQYHRALMQELTSGQQQRLGDAILAAQKAYAQTGLMPELLGVYHLLGDPALRIR